MTQKTKLQRQRSIFLCLGIAFAIVGVVAWAFGMKLVAAVATVIALPLFMEEKNRRQQAHDIDSDEALGFEQIAASVKPETQRKWLRSSKSERVVHRQDLMGRAILTTLLPSSLDDYTHVVHTDGSCFTLQKVQRLRD